MSADETSPVAVVLAEYSALKQELVAHITIYHSQTQFIQVYAAVLAALFTIIRTSSRAAAAANDVSHLVVLILLILAAAAAFHLGSAAMSTTYTFFILRRRLAQIERRINGEFTGDALLTYECKTAPVFFERLSYGPGLLTPQFLAACFQMAMLVAVGALLVVFGIQLLPPLMTICYAGLVALGAFAMIYQYVALCRQPGRNAIDAVFAQTAIPPANMRVAAKALLFVFNYFVVVLLFYVMTSPEARAWVSRTPVIAWSLAPSTSGLSKLFRVAVYAFLAGTVLPLPSEAPILLFDSSSVALILAACGIGKALGSMLIVALSRRAGHQLPKNVRTFLPRIAGDGRSWLIYFGMEAIPFAPMRTATLAFGAVVPPGLWSLTKIGALCAIATPIRMLAMWGLIHLGGVAINSIHP